MTCVYYRPAHLASLYYTLHKKNSYKVLVRNNYYSLPPTPVWNKASFILCRRANWKRAAYLSMCDQMYAFVWTYASICECINRVYLYVIYHVICLYLLGETKRYREKRKQWSVITYICVKLQRLSHILSSMVVIWLLLKSLMETEDTNCCWHQNKYFLIALICGNNCDTVIVAKWMWCGFAID